MKPRAPADAASSRWPAWVRYLLYFLLVAGLVRSLSGGSGGPKAGEPAAAFELPSVMTRGRVKLADYQGRPVLVEVFASWCPGCQKAAPMMTQLASDYRGRVEFVGISIDETAGQAQSAVEHWGIKYPVALDDGSFSQRYGINAVPTFVLIDSRGVVVRTVNGAPKRNALDAWLTELSRGGNPAEK